MSRTRHAYADRDATIDAAARAGKIRASDAPRYRKMYDAQPDVIRNLLTAKVDQGGLLPGQVSAQENAAALAAYDPSWLTAGERSALAGREALTPAPSPAPAAPASSAAEAASATEESGDEYDDSWLAAEERERIAAAKEGRLQAGPVDFEDAEARRAAGGGR